MAKTYNWIADYSVRLINGKQEDRRLGIGGTERIEATNIREALAIAQKRVEAMPKEDPEIEATFLWDIGVIESDYEF